MKTRLKREAYVELVDSHKAIGTQLKSRHRLRIGVTFTNLEKMESLLSKRDSWEKR